MMAGVIGVLIPVPFVQMVLCATVALGIILILAVKAGKADLANIITTTFSAIMLASLCFLQPFKEGNEIYTTATYEVMLILLAAFIACRSYQMVVILVVGALGVSLDYCLRIVPNGQGDNNWINLLICLCVLTISAFIGRGIMLRNSLLLRIAEQEALKNEDKVRDLQAVIRSSEAALGMGAAVKESSDRTILNIAQLKKISASASLTLSAFNDTAGRIADSNREIVDAAQSVKGRIEEQGAIVNESSASIEEMMASVVNIGKNAASTHQAAKQLKDATVIGATEMSQASDATKTMESSTASIGEIVKVIRKVASQTNLLAMNAAIEAAHAGSAGAGFSVVAGEIRKLSEETNHQVKLIEANVKEARASVRSSAVIMDNARATFGNIDNKAETMAKAIEEINNGLSQISAGSAEILAGVTRSVSITNEVKEAALKVDKTILTAANDLAILSRSGTSAGSSITEISSLLDGLLSEAEVMTASGSASERGLKTLGETLSSIKQVEQRDL
jgi:methyl-accepting chemotaxis protein